MSEEEKRQGEGAESSQPEEIIPEAEVQEDCCKGKEEKEGCCKQGEQEKGEHCCKHEGEEKKDERHCKHEKMKAELAKAAQDADWQNAMGVIALREGDNAAAAKYFAASGNATSKENAAVLDILNGKYADAAAKLASAGNCCNKVLAYILTDQLDQASAAATCGCAKTSYLKAVIAARQGKADDVKKYIDAASKDSKLAERATKDIEFAQYR